MELREVSTTALRCSRECFGYFGIFKIQANPFTGRVYVSNAILPILIKFTEHLLL